MINFAEFAKRVKASLPNFGPGVSKILDKIGLKDVFFKVSQIGFNLKPFGLMMQGSFTIKGFPASFSVLLGRFTKMFLAFDVGIESMMANSVLDDVLGSSATMFSAFKFSTFHLIISTSNVDIGTYPALQYSPDVLSLKRGFAVVANAKFSTTSSNPLIAMLGKTFTLGIQISCAVAENIFVLTVGIPRISVSGTVSFRDINFFISSVVVPPKMSIGFQASLQLTFSNNVLTFDVKASTRLHELSVGLYVAMRGFWKGAFGIPKLSIGNLVGEIGITVTPPYVASIMSGMLMNNLLIYLLGGSIVIGDPGSETAITGKLYFKISTKTPSENWFYGSISKLTVESLFSNIMGKNTFAMPKLLAESGFTKELKISYSLLGGISTPFGEGVPAGFRFAGEFNLLGFSASVEIIVSIIGFLKLTAVFSSFKLGFIRVLRSESDSTKGPSCYVEFRLSPFVFKFEINGYIDVMIFKANVHIFVSESSIRFETNVVLFQFLEARVVVQSNFGSFKDASINFEANVNTKKFGPALKEKVAEFKKIVQGALDKAKRDLQAAKNFLQSKKSSSKSNIELTSNIITMLEQASAIEAVLSGKDKSLDMAALLSDSDAV